MRFALHLVTGRTAQACYICFAFHASLVASVGAVRQFSAGNASPESCLGPGHNDVHYRSSEHPYQHHTDTVLRFLGGSTCHIRGTYSVAHSFVW